MSKYKHGDWYCVPMTAYEAKEIIARAIASGATNSLSYNGKHPYASAYGVIKGRIATNFDGADATKYTITKLREKFPLPGERVETVEYTHEYSDTGTYKQCSVVVSKPDSDGFIVVHDKNGCYKVVHELSVFKLRTEREKALDLLAQIVAEEADVDNAPAEKAAASIYDAIVAGSLKVPE